MNIIYKGEIYMEKKVQELINNEKKGYSINEIKQVYEEVDTSREVVIANTYDEKHIFYRDKETRKLLIERDLLQYAKILHNIEQHGYYPYDLCNLTFYDEEINRYGNGIIIPRLKKFVMINDNNLILEPSSSSFYTTAVDEDNHKCDSIVDKLGNIYKMYNNGEKNEDFNIQKIYLLNYKRFLMFDYFGFLVSYKGRPVFAEICEPPYMIFDRESLEKFGTINVGQMNDRSYRYLETFDDEFMKGKRYTKKVK